MSSSTTSNPLDLACFPSNYVEARQGWLAAAAELSLHCESLDFPCPGQGPDGAALFTDSIWIGPADAEQVVVILAGTHGIEGYAGSAVQTDWLHRLSAQPLLLPNGVALVLVHALTPWGYAWSRRCDADGVDLNRNAIDFSLPPPDNPHYRELRPILFEADAGRRQQAFAEFAARHGRTALEIAISGGQYLDPLGPFYGGRAPAHGRKVCEALISRYQLNRHRLAVVDIHTGLGAYGYGEIICDHAPNSIGSTLAKTWYGDAVTLPAAGTSSSVPKWGLLDYLWHAAIGDAGCYVTLEFGTYATDALFDVLLQDHLLWAQTGNDAARLIHRDAMRRHFCPEDPVWREQVLFRARQVIGQALAGLAR
ncbi:DUF2817 domain-containing protein [Methylomonas sp. CM2]|uniref:DUF2817 domain-containing protein n=1 Tax=Methylomonas sp. CM2 TaxID=3417647 RepID=UPI003CF4795F